MASTVRANVGSKLTVAEQYEISVVPAVVLFENGKELVRLEGVMPIDKMQSQLDRELRSKRRRITHYHYVGDQQNQQWLNM